MRTLGIDLSSLPKNTAICWISWDDGKAVVDEIKDNMEDRKSTRLNSSHSQISYAVFCLKKKKKKNTNISTHTKIENIFTIILHARHPSCLNLAQCMLGTRTLHTERMYTGVSIRRSLAH